MVRWRVRLIPLRKFPWDRGTRLQWQLTAGPAEAVDFGAGLFIGSALSVHMLSRTGSAGLDERGERRFRWRWGEVHSVIVVFAGHGRTGGAYEAKRGRPTAFRRTYSSKDRQVAREREGCSSALPVRYKGSRTTEIWK